MGIILLSSGGNFYADAITGSRVSTLSNIDSLSGGCYGSMLALGINFSPSSLVKDIFYADAVAGFRVSTLSSIII